MSAASESGRNALMLSELRPDYDRAAVGGLRRAIGQGELASEPLPGKPARTRTGRAGQAAPRSLSRRITTRPDQDAGELRLR